MQHCLDLIGPLVLPYVKKNKRKDKKLLRMAPFLRPGLRVIDSNGRAKKKVARRARLHGSVHGSMLLGFSVPMSFYENGGGRRNKR